MCDNFGKDLCDSVGAIYCKKPVYEMESVFSGTVTPAQLIYEDIGSGSDSNLHEISYEGFRPEPEKINENQCVDSYMECKSSEITKDVCEGVLKGKICKVFTNQVVIKEENDDNHELDPNIYSSDYPISKPSYSKLSFTQLSEVHELLKNNLQEVCLPNFDSTRN